MDRQDQKDHDLLVEAVTILRGLQVDFKEHKEDDTRHFANLYKETKVLRWYIGVGLGLALAIRIIFGN